MATMAELAEERRVRDEPMLEMVRAGRTAKQIGLVVGLAAGTVRHRVQKYGVKCVTWQDMAGIATKKPARMSKPCKCKGVCRSVHGSGHRFGPDLTCGGCGTSWYVHQRYPVECPSSKRPEPVIVIEERCKKGHPPGNLYISPKGKRQCRKCRADNQKKRDRNIAEKRKEERVASGALMNHCTQGHEWTDENTYRSPANQKRHCRACRTRVAKANWQKKKAKREGK